MYASQWRDATEAGRPQPPLSAGFTYELCAGIVDKDKSLEDIAREEVSIDTTEAMQVDSARWPGSRAKQSVCTPGRCMICAV